MSADVHPGGRPARILDVTLPRIHSSSCLRCASSRTSSVRMARMPPPSARGVLVSRGSPGSAEFSSSFPAVQPGAVIADRTGELGDRRRSADEAQQHVGRGVVAALQRRLAQLVQRQTAARLGPRYRRIGNHRSGIHVQHVGHHQLASLGLLQHPGRQVGLERRAHREHVAVAVRDGDVRVQVDRIEPDHGVVALFQQSDAILAAAEAVRPGHSTSVA